MNIRSTTVGIPGPSGTLEVTCALASQGTSGRRPVASVSRPICRLGPRFRFNRPAGTENWGASVPAMNYRPILNCPSGTGTASPGPRSIRETWWRFQFPRGTISAREVHRSIRLTVSSRWLPTSPPALPAKPQSVHVNVVACHGSPCQGGPLRHPPADPPERRVGPIRTVDRAMSLGSVETVR